MPRANRYYAPGLVWHIVAQTLPCVRDIRPSMAKTHRCHKKEFLLKFAKDRVRWIGWLYEAKRRYGLCVLNYIVTSNHIHLLVLDIQQHQSFQQMHQQWVEEELQHDRLQRDTAWSKSIAVGSETFVEKTKHLLKSRASHRQCKPVGDRYHLKEPEAVYQAHLDPDKIAWSDPGFRPGFYFYFNFTNFFIYFSKIRYTVEKCGIFCGFQRNSQVVIHHIDAILASY